ncbi:ribonucleotide reductase N-terminal alpha domain-containing protein, partial [Calditerrivibrio nitroreducens]
MEKIKALLTKEPELSSNAITVLKKRYLKRDAEGNLQETPKEMFQRVAINIAQADLNYNKDADIAEIAKKFYDIMVDLKFLPNSP